MPDVFFLQNYNKFSFFMEYICATFDLSSRTELFLLFIMWKMCDKNHFKLSNWRYSMEKPIVRIVRHIFFHTISQWFDYAMFSLFTRKSILLSVQRQFFSFIPYKCIHAPVWFLFCQCIRSGGRYYIYMLACMHVCVLVCVVQQTLFLFSTDFFLNFFINSVEMCVGLL